MGTMNFFKRICYFSVDIKGWIPGTALFFLAPCVHNGVVASVSSSFLLSTSIQETSPRAASFAPRAEAISERTKYS